MEVGSITTDEILNAVAELKNNKSAGLDEIQAEILKHGGDVLMNKLTQLCSSCWTKEKAPSD